MVKAFSSSMGIGLSAMPDTTLPDQKIAYACVGLLAAPKPPPFTCSGSLIINGGFETPGTTTDGHAAPTMGFYRVDDLDLLPDSSHAQQTVQVCARVLPRVMQQFVIPGPH